MFLNSHLLQELELVCESVAILVKGSVRLTGKVPELKKAISETPLIAELRGNKTKVEQTLAGFKSSEFVQLDSEYFKVELGQMDQSGVDEFVDKVRQNGISIESLHRPELTLEEAFLQVVEPSK